MASNEVKFNTLYISMYMNKHYYYYYRRPCSLLYYYYYRRPCSLLYYYYYRRPCNLLFYYYYRRPCRRICWWVPTKNSEVLFVYSLLNFIKKMLSSKHVWWVQDSPRQVASICYSIVIPFWIGSSNKNHLFCHLFC
jgi:hypothetical protein